MNSVQQRDGSVSVGPPVVLILKIYLRQAPPPCPQFLPFTLPLCCTEPYHKPSKRLGDVTTAPLHVFFIQLVKFAGSSSTAALWTASSHTAVAFMGSGFVQLCWMLAACGALVVSGCEVTRGEKAEIRKKGKAKKSLLFVMLCSNLPQAVVKNNVAFNSLSDLADTYAVFFYSVLHFRV